MGLFTLETMHILIDGFQFKVSSGTLNPVCHTFWGQKFEIEFIHTL